MCGKRVRGEERPLAVDPWIGREVGGYRIEDRIGSGGDGEVYRATQLSFGRPVAFRWLPPDPADDPGFSERFARQGDATAKLSHPNIVKVFDRGSFEGRRYLVMELVTGGTLRARMADSTLAASDARRITDGILSALEFAHTCGVLHGDLRPENVFVTPEGPVKVADFGLLSLLDSAGMRSRLASSRTVAGAFEYMAPERRLGEVTDPVSDLYSVGAILFEMLTGELPIGRFQLPKTDASLRNVIERALSQKTRDRFIDAAAMRAALERSAPPPPPLPAPPKLPIEFELRLDLLLTVLAVAGMLLSGWGLILLVSSRPFEVFHLTLDADYAGLLVLIYGLLLWNGAEQARRYRMGARSLLLALTAVAVPTLVAVPITLWTWFLLLDRRMRVYLDGRRRGLDAAVAAALAQGITPVEVDRNPVLARRAAAARANRTVAALLAALGIAAALALVILVSGADVNSPEAIAFLGLGALSWLLSFAFALLARRVEEGRSLRNNAAVWSVLGLLAPSAGTRARMLLRDQRDGLL